jgi:hypothetical protein
MQEAWQMDLWADDVPPELRDLIAKAEEAVETIKAGMESKIQNLRDRFDRDVMALQESAEQKIRLEQRHLTDKLKPAMEEYTRQGKLDEALAIRAVIQQFRQQSLNVRPNPGTLIEYQNDINKSFIFEVTGNSQGNLWGTDVYTADSDLSVAVVHAGILRPGEKGIVKVQIVDMQGMTISGSVRNNVRSSAWGPYPFGYKLCKP